MKIFRLKDHRSSLTLLGEPKKAKRREGEKRQKKGTLKKKEGKKGRAVQYSSSFADWEGNGLIPFFICSYDIKTCFPCDWSMLLRMIYRDEWNYNPVVLLNPSIYVFSRIAPYQGAR